MQQENLRVFIKARYTDDSNIVSIEIERERENEIKICYVVQENGKERIIECNLYILL